MRDLISRQLLGWTLALVGVCGTGCGAHRLRMNPDIITGLTLSMSVHKIEPNGQRALANGAELRNGDLVAVQVRVSTPAYVYVIQQVGTTSAPILGNAENLKLLSNRKLRLPSDRDGFRLEGATGLEEIIVIASLSPLGTTAGTLCTQFRLPCATPTPTNTISTRSLTIPVALGEGTAEPPPPPPPRCPNLANCRGDKTTQRQDADLNVITSSDEHGVAIAKFQIHQVP